MCKPSLWDENGLIMARILELVFEREESDSWCSCTLADKFIEDHWLCIPCFIKQEAEAYTRRLKNNIFKWETSEDGTRKLVGTVVCFLFSLLDRR